LLQRFRHPEHGYRSCLGLLSLAKRYGPQLRDLKLAGMASAVEEQLSSAASTGLSFEERLALMVDREVHHRDDKRRAALMKRAGLKYPQACIEDVDSKPGRGFERSSLMSLALSRRVEDGTAVLVTGPTGSGKSWLACALAQYACRRGHSALYLRVPRLAEDLHGNGGFGRWLTAVARTDVLLLDDWGLAADDITQGQAFGHANDVLKNAVGGISDIIHMPGLVNVDFEDVKTVMSEPGKAMMGTAQASGPDRAIKAAVACTLLEGIDLSGARGVLVLIAANRNTFKLAESRNAMNCIRRYAADDAHVIDGTAYDESLGDQLRVSGQRSPPSCGNERPAQ